MYLVLCSSFDAPALWAHEGLRAAGLADVELLTGERFAVTTAWEHRLGRSGVRTSFTLPDGRTVQDDEIGGVLNRLVTPPEPLLASACADDRDYALQELTSLYLSWLHALSCPVINRPAPMGLAGRWRHASEWLMLAREVGLPAQSYRQSGDSPPDDGYGSLAPVGTAVTPIIVFDGEVFGACLPASTHKACVAFARAAETALLGIDLFTNATGQMSFGHANPIPNLMIGGEPLLDRLVQVFRNGGAA
ncbi:MAG: hypothetical protein JO227_25230 [Acetobacteraceae bacterium]|nr:hypothetical protein [Acetobacteraceae bacterium]